MSGKIQNPILRGFHPDPSIVRVGEDYYILSRDAFVCGNIFSSQTRCGVRSFWRGSGYLRFPGERSSF